jgi:hypothetical protein
MCSKDPFLVCILLFLLIYINILPHQGFPLLYLFKRMIWRCLIILVRVSKNMVEVAVAANIVERLAKGPSLRIQLS